MVQEAVGTVVILRVNWVAAVCLCLGSAGAVERAVAQKTIDPRDPWEAAIGAKGGREALHTVRNLLITSIGAARAGGKNTDRAVKLFVLPTKLWRWVDERPTKFGLWLQVTDLDRGVTQMAHSAADTQPPAGKPTISDAEELHVMQALFFMETKWFQPHLREAQTDRNHAVVITTAVADQTINFYLDRQSHLPMRVVVRSARSMVWEDQYELSKYAAVDGIMLPHEITRRSTLQRRPFRERLRYELNVEYDPAIFTKAPSFENGPDGWKPR